MIGNSTSFPRDCFVCLGPGDIAADSAEGPNLVSELLGRMDALAEWEGVGVVVHLHLALASDAVVDSADARVLLIQPRPLNVGLLLGVV